MPEKKPTRAVKAKRTAPKKKATAAAKKAKSPRKAKPAAAKAATATKAAPPRATRTSKGLAPTSPPRATTNPARRAIFIDVENTSNEESLSRVIENLKVDHAAQPTELFAFGNWRAVGQTMSRHLARLGATLVHTSPVTGVKDWSDLWIAVAAGRWIALAKPGDMLEIVSNDKAFEAVGDAAATAGVIFRRVLHRIPGGAAAAAAAAAEGDGASSTRRRRRRGGRGRRRSGSGTGAASASTRAESAADTAKPEPAAGAGSRPEPRRRQESSRREPRRHETARAPQPKAEAPVAEVRAPEAVEAEHADGHGASHDQVLATIRRLTNNDPSRWVNLDLIATALKSEGFTRPPGSPRLVVRLRRMKDVEVQSNGMVRLVS